MKMLFRLWISILLPLLPCAALAQTTGGSSVNIESPTNGQTFTAPTNITFTVAVDTNAMSVNFIAQPGGSNSVTPIAIFLGSVSNFISLDPPTRIYNFVWSNAPAGAWFVVAGTVLGNGDSGGSAGVQFTVERPSSGSSFSIDLASPTNGSFYPGPTNIQLIAGVAVSNDTVTAVEFFDGSNEIGIATNFVIIDPPGSPGLPPGGHAYFLEWSNQTPGVHILTATASDTNGQTKTSAPVIVTVGPITPPPPPVVIITEPYNGTIYTAPATIPIDAQIYDPAGKVAYVSFKATLFPSNNDAISTITLGNVSNFVSEPPDKLYSLVWSNVQAGSWVISAIAVSSNGSTLGSTNVSISVGTTPPPQFSIDIASPTNGTFYPAPSNIQLIADISGTNQDVPYVKFLDGTNEIAISTNFAVVDPPGAPGEPPGSRAYLLQWTNGTPGVHILRATAPNESGIMITSAPVTISIGSVRPPPLAVTITQPTNGQTFRAPTSILINADVSNGGDVAYVTFTASPGGLGPRPLTGT
ncbi:MAG TPA: Ig-like domain-containing protein, partial [Verrucomicrobiae bacterium]